jgi:hypothetical protein
VRVHLRAQPRSGALVLPGMLGTLLLLTIESTAMSAPLSSKSDMTLSPERAQSPTAGCCSDPDVPNYGIKLDFTSRTEGEEITTQYRAQGVLFGRGGSSSATPTVIHADGARPFCPNQLTLSGLPHFDGWEFFIFVDPTQNRWATVDKVGASVGYCDVVNACFMAAYDLNGNLVGITRNSQIGFQFLSVQSATPNISCVLIGDCQIGFVSCVPDPAGSATNCLTFPSPVSQPPPPALPPPDSLPLPPPPPGPPPATPSTCSASDNSTASVTFTWADVSGESGYTIKRDGSTIATLAANTTSYTDVPPAGLYTYCVEAFNANGSSSGCCDPGTRRNPAPAPGASHVVIRLLLVLLALTGVLAVARRKPPGVTRH